MKARVTGVTGHPVGTDLRDSVRELINKQGDLEWRIQELRGKLKDARHRKQENEERMMDVFIDTGMYHLLKIDHTALRRYVMEVD